MIDLPMYRAQGEFHMLNIDLGSVSDPLSADPDPSFSVKADPM
jgi:hypothetical protein